MEIKGRIHSFESFGTVDGPGIRFVVFMQGCPLRCVYCHNRDTWNPKGGTEYTSAEIIEKLKPYLDYIKFSGGGITVTGGEPTLQAEFVTELFKECKELGVHTALDTSGFADIEKVTGLLEFTDLVLLDIKHAVDEKHRLITGVGNEKIRRFAYYIRDKGIPAWIRYVLVPDYTDSKQDLERAREFISELTNVVKVEVLPYHTLGEYKWEELNKKYELSDVREPIQIEIKIAKNILQDGRH